MIYLYSLTIVDINLANLTDDKIACFGLNIVDPLLLKVDKFLVHLETFFKTKIIKMYAILRG